jgi:hypothetical protein
MNKNLHLEHLEDTVLNFGTQGAKDSVELLNKGFVPTVKYDGSPAVFAGTDPSDGKFFVAKKSVFNKTPILYKTPGQIKKADLPNDLKDKFMVALTEFKKLGIQGVIQGDIMFTKNDIKRINSAYVTFQPNTITYRLQEVEVRDKNIGVVWHTQYTGKSLETMTASFDFSIDSLKQTKNVWQRDANYKGGFVSVDTNNINIPTKLTKFLNIQNSFPSKLIGAKLKTFNNKFVMDGKKLPSSKKHAKSYITYVKNRYNIEIDKLKTVKARTQLTEQRDQVVKALQAEVNTIQSVVEFQKAITTAKNKVINKLNKNHDVACFIGEQRTNPEGYVAISKSGPIKLVNRYEFSYNNFNGEKQWQKQ